MAVQFAGSSSTGDRRRRRLVANGDGAGIDTTHLDRDGAEIESQLVASEAAGPWVPVTELRIWIYATLIGMFLAGLTFALARPNFFHVQLIPLTDHLFVGSTPVAAVFTEVAFLTLSAQLGLLIGWYRARCKLDFGGRYRVWPWAVALFGIAAFCFGTGTHRALGQLVGKYDWFPWRGVTVAWLLPCCLAALPISLFLDRDMRNSRSSLWTLRLSGILWLAEAWFELYQPELQSQPWFNFTYLVLPIFASATLFVGLWLHARVVAYVCPDPPELDERSAWSHLLAACAWIGGSLMFWRRREASAEDDTKPKRRRKKAEAEEVGTKRKRKTPAKRATARTRTRTKSTEDEVATESSDETVGEESDSSSDFETSSSESNSAANEQEDQWEEEPVEQPPVRAVSKGNGRFTEVHNSHNSSTPAPHSRRQTPSWEEESNEEDESARQSAEVSDDNDDDGQSQGDSAAMIEQMKGMSKRQKREFKKQLREQERSRGR